MPDSPEAKSPQLNIRPGVDVYGRLVTLAAVRSLSPPEMARRILTAAIDEAFAQYPELGEAHTALEIARDAIAEAPE
jgi:hypothetical protein